MTPYWQDDARGLRIYHGDCRDLLPCFADGEFSFAILDPTYAGITPAAANPRGSTLRAMSRSWANWHPVELWFEWMTNEAQRVSRGYHLFCNAQVFPLAWKASWVRGGRTQVLIWDKESVGLGTGYRSQTELIVFHQDADGIDAFDSRNVFRVKRVSGGEKLEPGQKPEALLSEILLPLPGLELGLIDPYAGTGTTLAVAATLGVPAIGIEADIRRCDMIVARLSEDLSYGEANLFNLAEAAGGGA